MKFKIAPVVNRGFWLCTIASIGPFVIYWIWPNLFVDFLSPLITRDDLIAIVPKLGKDLKVIEQYSQPLRLEPFFYTYFTALILSSVVAFAFAPFMFFVPKPEAAWTKQLAEIDGKLTWPLGRIVLILAMIGYPFLLWMGPSFIAEPDCFPPRCYRFGPFHDVIMCLFLFGYSFVVMMGAPVIHIMATGKRAER
ncbi:MAG: hypothetical protein ACPGGK_15560 [Pikeienuella sp.]